MRKASSDIWAVSGRTVTPGWVWPGYHQVGFGQVITRLGLARLPPPHCEDAVTSLNAYIEPNIQHLRIRDLEC